MTQNKLKKLKKSEMLKLLLEQQRQIESLSIELSEARAKLSSRSNGVKHAGSVAEATMALGTIFDEAQQAAAEYMENIQSLSEKDAGEAEDSEESDPEPPVEARIDLPTSEQIEAVITQRKYRKRYFRVFQSTVFTLVTVSAVAVLIAVLLMPVLQIYGSSMNPTLIEGDYIVSVKTGDMKTGDIVAFYYNNKVLIKRVIGQAGQWIDIAEDGTVYVDDVEIDEPYLIDKAFGECDLELPYQVPESRVFVMGDNRSVSVDSRSTTIGCVAEEQLVGKVVFCVWPLSRFGAVA